MTNLWGVSRNAYRVFISLNTVEVNKVRDIRICVSIIVRTLKSGTPIRFSFAAISAYELKLSESLKLKLRLF